MNSINQNVPTEKKAKDRIEAYAKEKFGVDLDKRRSLRSLEKQVAELEERRAKYSKATQNLDDDTATVVVVHEAGEIQAVGVGEVDAMNHFASCIYANQSPDLPIGERVSRIILRLKDAGYSDFSQLEIPDSRAWKKYL